MNASAKPLIDEIRASIIRLKEQNTSLRERLQEREAHPKGEEHEATIAQLTQQYESVLAENDKLKATNEGLIRELEQLKEIVDLPKFSEPPKEIANDKPAATTKAEEPQKHSTDDDKPSDIQGPNETQTTTEAANISAEAPPNTSTETSVETSTETSFGDDPFANEEQMSDDDDFFKTIADK